MNYKNILNFWFNELEPRQWFMKDQKLDNRIIQEFGKIHDMAVTGELWKWRVTPEGRLAEIIVLDQFTRNMFRDGVREYLYDGMSLALAQEAVRTGADKKLKTVEKSFIYMPYMHSESKIIHDETVILFSQPGLEESLKFEFLHKEMIDRFGRYPYRNEILGRISTPEEIEFLKTPGSSF